MDLWIWVLLGCVWLALMLTLGMVSKGGGFRRADKEPDSASAEPDDER